MQAVSQWMRYISAPMMGETACAMPGNASQLGIGRARPDEAWAQTAMTLLLAVQDYNPKLPTLTTALSNNWQPCQCEADIGFLKLLTVAPQQNPGRASTIATSRSLHTNSSAAQATSGSAEPGLEGLAPDDPALCIRAAETKSLQGGHRWRYRLPAAHRLISTHHVTRLRPKLPSPAAAEGLGDRERVPDALGRVEGVRTLIAILDAQDVQHAVADRGGDQVVAPAQRVVSCAESTGREESLRTSVANTPQFFGFLFLGDGEGIPSALRVLVDALEPPLVANLDLEDVDLAARHCRCDELVAAALVAVSCGARHESVREQIYVIAASMFQLHGPSSMVQRCQGAQPAHIQRQRWHTSRSCTYRPPEIVSMASQSQHV